jgi:hypothetical protein
MPRRASGWLGMLSAEKLADLRAKAEAATPGPWTWAGDEPWLCAPDLAHVVEDGSGTIVVESNWESAEGHDAEYLSAVDPTTVLALLDAVDRLRAEVKLFQARVRIEPSDIERLGLTLETARTVLLAHGWTVCDDSTSETLWANGSRRIRLSTDPRSPFMPQQIAQCAASIASGQSFTAWDVLDEMAAVGEA